MRTCLILSAALLAALSSGAAAQTREPGPGGRHHGRLFISPMGEPFRGGDGLATWLGGADADHDGAVTSPEFQQDAVRFFRLLDRNGDGVLDGFELQAYERDVAPEITSLGFDEGPGLERERSGGGRGARQGHGGGMGGFGGGKHKRSSAPRRGAGRYSLLDIPQPVASADEDVDGKVTLAEWTHTAQRRFGMLDRAGAGRLTLDGPRPPQDDPKG